jgi:hypothetical protein
MMIRLKDIINEDSKAGWGSDPNKPRKVAAIENKTRDLLASWKRGFRPGWENSPRIARLRKAWEDAVETSGWKPKYNFGDVLA